MKMKLLQHRVIVSFYVLLFVSLTITCLTTLSYAQTTTAAVPFLLNSPSAELNGMGEVTTGLESQNAFAIYWNPAQLGLMSMNSSATVGFSHNSAIDFSDGKELTNKASVYQAGVNLSQIFKLPVGLSFGMAYSTLTNDLGTFTYTSNTPEPLGQYEAKETADQYSFGLGLDHGWFNLGLGLTYKNINSRLAPFELQYSGKQGVANVGAIDKGLFIGINTLEAVSYFSKTNLSFLETYSPFLDLGFGYSVCNVGNEVTYIDASQSDPLPRTVREGFSVSMGVTYTSDYLTWKPITFRLGNEASDLLVHRWTVSDTISYIDAGDTVYYLNSKHGWDYKSGTGDINFFDDVLFGKGNNGIEKRKGWELGFGELLYLRGGRIEDSEGNRDVTTTGYGLHLKGAFKFIMFLNGGSINSKIIGWVFDHVDFSYNRSTGTASSFYEAERTYQDFMLTVRK